MAAIKTIGILTSGGDAPGMNAAIRAVTRTAIYNKFSVKGIKRGYYGLVYNEIEDFTSRSVSNIIQQGGTILKTARCKEFATPEGRKTAYDNMRAAGIDALVVIGGDGSLTGARIFAEEYDIPIVGLPGTIDNDLGGTDSTIGYDTALNTIVDAVDKIRDTATQPRAALLRRGHGTYGWRSGAERGVGLGCRGGNNSRNGDSDRPAGRSGKPRISQEQKFGYRPRGGEPLDGRCHGACRAYQEGVPAVRRPRDDPRPPATRRFAHGGLRAWVRLP